MVQSLKTKVQERRTGGLSYWEEEQFLLMIGQLREVFEEYFDRTWLSNLIDELPVDFKTVREIRVLLSRHSIRPGDEQEIFRSILELECFIEHIKRYLLPNIKERLGVSALTPHRLVRDKQQYIIRRLVAYTFPHNLERLYKLTEELKSYLLLIYPSLQ